MAFKPNIDEIRDTLMGAAQIRPTAICSLSGEKRTSSLSTPQNESDHQGKSYDGLHLDSELDRLSEYLEISKNELEARQELRFLHSIINLMPVGLTVRSQHGKCLLANESAAYLSIAPKLASEAPSPASENPAKNDAINPWANIIRSGLTTTTEERVGEGHNERIFLTCHKPVRIDNEPLLLSASVDYTDRKRQEDELSQRAYLDELTGLPNRVLIEDHVERLISSGDQSCGRFALAFIDLDNFKHINDYYTHAIGDALLKKVAQRITSQVRSSDVLGQRASGMARRHRHARPDRMQYDRRRFDRACGGRSDSYGHGRKRRRRQILSVRPAAETRLGILQERCLRHGQPLLPRRGRKSSGRCPGLDRSRRNL
jgi:hypothetical protein